jgi:hypothetical protein
MIQYATGHRLWASGSYLDAESDKVILNNSGSLTLLMRGK